jgi:hypothetical protein
MIGGRFFASEAAAPSAVIILKKIDMDRIEIVNKYCGGGTLPKVITEPSPIILSPLIIQNTVNVKFNEIES